MWLLLLPYYDLVCIRYDRQLVCCLLLIYYHYGSNINMIISDNQTYILVCIGTLSAAYVICDM